MLILLRLRGDSQPEPEFSGFFVHIHTYPVQPKTRADLGIKLVSPRRPRHAYAAAAAPAHRMARAHAAAAAAPA
jgi:hypothetical protein